MSEMLTSPTRICGARTDDSRLLAGPLAERRYVDAIQELLETRSSTDASRSPKR
jgi:hypothetical protein